MMTIREVRMMRRLGVPWIGVLRIALFKLGIVWVAKK